MSVWDLFKRKKKKPEKVDPAANLNQETEEKPAAEKAELETQEKAEREAREKAEREAREKAEREKAEHEAREKAEREAREKAEHEAREKAEREAREKAEHEAREKAEREAREKAEHEAREKAEREAREKAEREAREKAEREAREKAEREAREKAELEAREKAAAEKSSGKKKKEGFFSKLMGGLKKTRDTLFGGLFVENGEKIDDEFYEELEEAMIISDMGMATTEKLLGQLRSKLRSEGVHTRTEAKQVMISLLADCMRPEDGFLDGVNKAVILVVGVNGVGKTTSIGKLAAMYKADGRSVMLAAGDTFRAAAAEQLTIWAERADVPIVKHGEGADPAAVVFDAIASFKAKNCDILICDTAGRLHNKKNLMTELAKIRKVIGRELPDVPVEVLLVLDATTGQNAIAQAKVFGENCGLTGVVLTKLDGTAKGGVSVAVKDELGLPVRFVGVGEGIDDLQPFDADDFAKALLG
jgi:fused signal recognition particle receptor